MNSKQKKAKYMLDRYHAFRAKGLCGSCGSPSPESARCDRCKEREYKAAQKPSRKHKAYLCHNKWLKAKRDILFQHYGAKCVWCGCTVREFLTFDHVNDDGAEHRRNMTGTAYYTSIIKAGFPPSIQVLCFNCNCSKQFSHTSKDFVQQHLGLSSCFTDGAGI